MPPLVAFALAPPVMAQGTTMDEAESFFQKIRSSVVLVRLQKQMSITESADGLRQVLLNGALVDTRFRPNIVKVIQSSGFAYDKSGHVVAYIGYGWLALNPRDPGVRVDLMRYDGFTSPGKLVGVDQRAGIVILQTSSDLPLQPRGLVQSASNEFTEGALKRPFYLVDLDGQQAVRKVTVNRKAEPIGLFKGTSKFVFNSGERVRQGQMVFARDGNLFGFVNGSDPGSASGDPEGVTTAQRVLVAVDKIIDSGQDIPAGWLGLYIETQGDERNSRKIMVREVVPGSPAQASGIHRNDLLLAVDGAELREAADFLAIVRWSEIGSRLQLQTQRGNSISTLPIQVAARSDVPEPNPSTLYLQFSTGGSDSATPQIELSEVQTIGRSTGQVSALVSPPRLGLVGDDLTPQLGNFFGVEGGRGVLIISVAPGSLAERYGMKAGDVIVALNEDTVSNQLNFLRILERHSGDAIWNIRMMRERKSFEVKITLRSDSPKK